MTNNTMRAQFHEWAEKDGNDMAYAYDANRGAFVYLNPFTADLWSAWQAARTVPDELRKDAEKWRDLCSRVGADPSGTIAYAGPLEGAPEDWAAIAQEGE